MNALELVEVLEGLEVPMFAEIDIFEREPQSGLDDVELRVMFCRAPIEAPVDTVVITNDPTYPGVRLWPRP
jgi:hypothetical protein